MNLIQWLRGGSIDSMLSNDNITLEENCEEPYNNSNNDQDLRIACQKCKFKSDSIEGMINHSKKLHKELITRCRKCNFETYDANDMKVHNDICYNNCKECVYNSLDLEDMKSHVEHKHKS